MQFPPLQAREGWGGVARACGAVEFNVGFTSLTQPSATIALRLTYYAKRNTFAVVAIQSFACKHTQALFEGGHPRKFRAFEDAAIRKLTQLDVALTLDFLRSPPGHA
jgi:hypothetical protein